MHEQRLMPKCVGCKAEPKNMRMYPRELMPYDAQILCTLWDFNAHELLDRLRIAHGMSECANAANAFCNVDELVVVLRANEALETTVNEADLGNGFENHFIFDDKVKMYRLRQYRVLGTEGDDRFLSHRYSPPFIDACRERASRTLAALSASIIESFASRSASFECATSA